MQEYNHETENEKVCMGHLPSFNIKIKVVHKTAVCNYSLRLSNCSIPKLRTSTLFCPQIVNSEQNTKSLHINGS